MNTADDLPPVWQVPPTEGHFDGEPAVDFDPAAGVVEIRLEAREAEVELAPGHTAPLWTYNGTMPGPRIEAHVGDTVRVHLKNSLPEATTIHWHGLRVPADMDGVPAVSAPVQPGEETTYEFVVPDAGTFWYHPHVRSDQQVERGLYGAFVVRGDDEPQVTSEHIVVLDDMLVNSDWSLADFDPKEVMLGRQGNLVLANGRAHPVVELTRGGLHRFRFVNAANARYFRLALPDRALVQIGTDGGPLEAPVPVDDLLLVPGERADVLVEQPAEYDDAVDWLSTSYERGHGTGEESDVPLFEVQAADGEPVSTPDLPTWTTPIDRLPVASIQRRLTLQETMDMGGMDMGGMDMGSMSTTFSINGQTFPDIEPLVGALGDVEEWTLVNETEMDHPFHLHGFRFQVVSDNGAASAFAAWRDTVNVKAKATIVFRVRLDDHPGTWMFHCHILEHAENGMMGELIVTER